MIFIHIKKNLANLKLCLIQYFQKFTKEGYKFLAISILATFIVLFFSKLLGLIFILITIWVYYFFRDPERYSINDDLLT